MAKKSVRQFMHKVAALAIRVMSIVMHNGSTNAAWHCHRGKGTSLNIREVRDFRTEAS
ncbi:MAG: hypothetical protein M3N07_05295 [Pseudomonadota bacterium]|nr:hypothetical protein [Pseudomonadota bacterium]